MLSTNLLAANSSITVTVTPECINTGRIDRYLASRFPLYSRSFFAQLLLHGVVVINNQVIAKASSCVRPGDVIVFTLPAQPKAPTDNDVKQYTAHINPIHEHDHFLIINKPAGILVHSPAHNSVEPTVVDWLAARYPDGAHAGYVDRPGIVHRLDRDTSGIMILVRTNHAFKTFGVLFEQRLMAKSYLAVVHGHPAQSGTIDFGISRHPIHRNKMMAHTPVVNKSQQYAGTIRNAVTNYEVLQYFDEYSLVLVKPVTGRTHQIRVHFSAIGHPLVGDYLYGTKSSLIARHALHAHTIAFVFDGHHHTFTVNLPDDFNAMIAKLPIANRS